MVKLCALEQPQHTPIQRLAESVRQHLEKRCSEKKPRYRTTFLAKIELLLAHPELLDQQIDSLPLNFSEAVLSPRAWTTIKVGTHANKESFFENLKSHQVWFPREFNPLDDGRHCDFVDFRLMDREESIGLIGLSGADFGWTQPVPFATLMERAERFGFRSCPVESALQVSLQQREFAIAYGKKLTFTPKLRHFEKFSGTGIYRSSGDLRLITLKAVKEWHGFRMEVLLDPIRPDKSVSPSRVFIFKMS